MALAVAAESGASLLELRAAISLFQVREKTPAITSPLDRSIPHIGAEFVEDRNAEIGNGFERECAPRDALVVELFRR